MGTAKAIAKWDWEGARTKDGTWHGRTRPRRFEFLRVQLILVLEFLQLIQLGVELNELHVGLGLRIGF